MQVVFPDLIGYFFLVALKTYQLYPPSVELEISELFEVLEFKITTDSCERLFRVNGILMVYKTKRDEESSNVTFTNRRWITQGRSVPEQGRN